MKKITNQKGFTPIGSGFTLIELLVVVTIIGILATLSTVNYLGAKQRARDAQRKSDIVQLRSAFEMYRIDQSAYPATASLSACGKGTKLTNVSGTVYINNIPCDPLTKQPYKYATPLPGGYSISACLENSNDSQKDTTNTCSSSYYSITNINP